MALAPAIQNALRPAQEITWADVDGTPLNLTGSTITGKIRDRLGAVRDIAGTLELTDAASGVFTWNYHADDVGTAGNFTVQFTATFGTAPSPAKTLMAEWIVYLSLG